MNDQTKRSKAVAEEELVGEDDTIIGVAFRWSLVVVALVAVGGGAIYYFTRERETATVIPRDVSVTPPEKLRPPSAEIPLVVFKDIAVESGIDFVHENGARGQKLLPETMGGGCAFLDSDSDGDQDVLLVNSTWWPGEAPPGKPLPTMSLYRNDGTGKFENVTAGSGLDISMYGMGCAVGDIDNDGDSDVFITAVGANRLFLNEGGRFRDITATAGVAGKDDEWSTSAGFFDYDNDGRLDLFVCNYVQWSRDIDLNLNFTLNGVDRAYGPPRQYRGTYPYLYRNNGDGTFEDVSAAAGFQINAEASDEPMAKALAVVFVDIDHDGLTDIMVANDTVRNFLFRNRGDGTFEETGQMAGVGFDSMGAATGAMGIDAGDFRNANVLGIGIGNFANEPSSFYVQRHRGQWSFDDRSNAEGIGSQSRLALSFGLFLFDCDLNGWLDIFQANGHLEDEINQIQPSQHYRQPAQLFWNCGPGAQRCYALMPGDQVGDLARPIVGRGAAYADIDGDGDQDVLITQIRGAPMLLRNDQQLGHHWLRVQLIGAAANRDAIGSWIELTADGVTQRRQVMPTRSYLSQVELPVTFGLGNATTIESLKVTWPGGTTQTIETPTVDQAIVIRQGS